MTDALLREVIDVLRDTKAVYQFIDLKYGRSDTTLERIVRIDFLLNRLENKRCH